MSCDTYYEYALDDDSNSTDLDSADDSNNTVFLNGMTIIFDQAVPVSPINLIPKTKQSALRTSR